MTRKRRRGQEERENHDRWLVSYADFITLLFAFFVVMYSISSVNEGRYRVLSNALSNAFGYLHANPTPSPVAPIIASVAPPAPIKSKSNSEDEKHKKETKKMQDLADRILKVLAPLVKDGQVRVTRGARGVAVEINASLLFAPAQALLQPDSIAALKAVAEVLASIEEPIQVEGHTDDVPISTSQFPSNWELSSARASTVARFFIENGITGQRLAATGYAENRPIDSNLTPEGRARNRRVTLMILTAQP
jgi:chemotaxis protein MotB